MSNAGELFFDDKWLDVVWSIKEAADATLHDFSFVVNEDCSTLRSNVELAESSLQNEDWEKQQKVRLVTAISDVKSRAAVQFLPIQAITEIQNMYRRQLSAKNTMLLFDAVHGIANHSHNINTDITLRSKLQDLGPMTQMQDPPLLRLENESYQICLAFVQNLDTDKPPFYEESQLESHLVDLCHKVLKSYIEIAHMTQLSVKNGPHWLIPLAFGKKRELTARGSVIVTTYM